jgi:predicted O-methyltransferase YrrM
MEHTSIAKLAMADAEIAQSRYRFITNSVMDVMTKLTDRAYDLVVYRHNSEDLSFAISEAHRILRSGGVFVIDNFFGGSKVQDPAQRDPKTIALREAGKAIKADTESWVSSLIPTGDGLLLATKL